MLLHFIATLWLYNKNIWYPHTYVNRLDYGNALLNHQKNRHFVNHGRRTISICKKIVQYYGVDRISTFYILPNWKIDHPTAIEIDRTIHTYLSVNHLFPLRFMYKCTDKENYRVHFQIIRPSRVIWRIASFYQVWSQTFKFRIK